MTPYRTTIVFKTYRYLLLLLFLSINGLMTVQALLDAAASAQVSSNVADIIIEVVEEVVDPSQLPADFYDGIVFFVRKGLGHVGFNFLSGLLLTMTLLGFSYQRNFQPLFWAIAIALSVYGEGLQWFAVGRSARIEDVGYNLLGYTVSFMIYFYFYKKKKVLF